MKKICVFLLLLILPMSVFARFEEVIDDASIYFKKKEGIVVSSKGNEVIIDLGKKDFLYKGELFKISRESKKVIHPITGKVLGIKSISIATIRVDQVYDDFSICIVNDSSGVIKSKDNVISSRGTEISVQFINFSNRHQLLLKEEFSASPILTVKDNSSIKLKAVREDKGGITVTLSNKEDEISSKYYSDIKMTSIKQEAVDIVRSEILDYDFLSIAVGDPFGDDSLIVAAASERKLFIYRFTGKKFEQLQEIEGDFDRITNIEFLDLNKNGKDELFVSHVSGRGGNNSAQSLIYESEKGRFTIIQNNIRLLLRSIMDEGDKSIICQRITKDGRFIGLISYFQYSNSIYAKGDSILGSAGKTLYGFGYGDVDGDGKKEILWINNDFKLVVSDDEGVIYEGRSFLGHTSNYFLMGEFQGTTLIGGELEELTSSDDYLGSKSEYQQYIKGRIYISKEPKTIFVAENNPISNILENTYSYSSASIRSIIWKDGLRDRWKFEGIEPEILDYESFEDNGNDYIIIVNQKKGGLFGSNKSQFSYIELK